MGRAGLRALYALCVALSFWVAALSLLGPHAPRHVVVTLDGASGVGKSPAADILTREYNLLHVEQGKYFRALTHLALVRGMDPAPQNQARLRALLEQGCTEVVFGNSLELVCSGGQVMTPELLRSPEVNANVARYAALPRVRQFVKQRVRGSVGLALARGMRGVLCDGRVCGTAVFPEAQVKLFFRASMESRSHRRHDVEGEVDDLAARDALDSGRAVDPFVMPPGASAIETTGLGYDEIVRRVREVADQPLRDWLG